MLQKRENRDQILARIAENLSENETLAYDYWRLSEVPGIAPSLNAKLFNLWLNGKSCEEIRRLNPQLHLGQIVSARIEGDWDKRRDEHLDRLLSETSVKVQQATLETAEFVCDLLAVANHEHGDKLKRYLQTGDAKDLGEFRIGTLTGLKTAIEMLQKLTGQDKQQKVMVSGEVVHRQEAIDSITSDQASRVMKLLIEQTKDK